MKDSVNLSHPTLPHRDYTYAVTGDLTFSKTDHVRECNFIFPQVLGKIERSVQHMQ